MNTAARDEDRFAFGENWRSFLENLDEDSTSRARDSLVGMLDTDDLSGKAFLDVGCGSGLFSLAAKELGARVVSFDYDEDSVQCTESLKKKYYEKDKNWQIYRGSILDDQFLTRLGQHDIVYAWGVLHHTGDMRAAMDQVARLTKKNGTLYIALYNDQGVISRYWKAVKLIYNRFPLMRPVLKTVYMPYLVWARYLSRMIKGDVRLERGMSYWHDMVDWLGGYPFEVASRDEVVSFYSDRGFSGRVASSCGRRSGCNEFLFEKTERLV